MEKSDFGAEIEHGPRRRTTLQNSTLARPLQWVMMDLARKFDFFVFSAVQKLTKFLRFSLVSYAGYMIHTTGFDSSRLDPITQHESADSLLYFPYKIIRNGL